MSNTKFENNVSIQHSTHTGRIHYQLLAAVFTLCLISILIFTSKLQAQEQSNFYLHQNGVTVICDEAEIGESGEINGVEYTKRTSDQITVENAAATCTSGIRDMNRMFAYQNDFNEDITHWDVSSVTTMAAMFEEVEAFNRDIGNWDVRNVNNMGSMFLRARNFDRDISSWNVSNVTNMRSMFEIAVSFNQDISGWNVSSVINMGRMFRSARRFNQSLSEWDVSSVTDMHRMFQSASSFNGNIGNWDVSNVTNMSNMFWSADKFNGDIRFWDVSSVTDMNGMFRDAGSFFRNLSNWCVTNISEEPFLFSQNSPLDPEHLPQWGQCPERGIELLQNFPNPFNTSTVISYYLSEESDILLEVYDIQGRLVAVLINEIQPPGLQDIRFDASGLASGVYIYRIAAGNITQSRKLMHLK